VAFVEAAGGEKKRWELGLSTDIGRDPGSAIAISDWMISRNHAEIRRTADGRFRIVDLNSKLGTYVGGTRITEHLLKDGDEIQIGTTILRFGDPAAEAPPAVPTNHTSNVTVLQRHATGPDTFPPAEEQKDVKRLRQDYERLRAAFEIGRSVSIEGGLDALLAKIAWTAIRLLKADRVAILLNDPKTGLPVPRLTRTREGTAADVVVSQSILREVTTQGVGMICADAGSDARFKAAQSVMLSGMRSAMCVPLVHEGEVLGAIHCDTLLKTGVFRDEDLALFSSIAGQAAISVRNALLLQRVQEEASTRVQFQRFFSPTLVEQIVTGRLKVSQKGEVLPVTVLFSDVRGFTRMSEGLKPDDVVDLLNAYFERMVEVLFRHEGTLDKYVGDELMALFGAPAPLPEPTLSAVRCALEMREELAAFNLEQRGLGRPVLSVGFGIHAGPALCGMFGSTKTRQYTAMGDTVNTASRLCSIAKGGEVIVSRAVRDALGDRAEVRPLPPVEVKGKSRPLEVFDVVRVG
jgi:adenylate cyclase